MRGAVVVACSRTPLAKLFRGSFNLARPDDLAAHCIKDVLQKTSQLDPAEVADVIIRCGYPHRDQAFKRCIRLAEQSLLDWPPPLVGEIQVR